MDEEEVPDADAVSTTLVDDTRNVVRQLGSTSDDKVSVVLGIAGMLDTGPRAPTRALWGPLINL